MFLLYKKARIHLEIITLVFVRSPFCSSLHLLLMIFIMFDPVDNKIILESIIIEKKRSIENTPQTYNTFIKTSFLKKKL